VLDTDFLLTLETMLIKLSKTFWPNNFLLTLETMLIKLSKTFWPNNFGVHRFFKQATETKGQILCLAVQTRGVVYKVGYLDCNFIYYGHTVRALKTGSNGHKKSVQVGDSNSKVAQHMNQFVHSIRLPQCDNCRQGS